MDAHGITVVNEAPREGGPRFNSSSLMLGNMVHVIDNAIYWIEFAERPSKTLFFAVEHVDDFEKIAIADSGTGFFIEPSDAVRPFVSEKEGGMGIGLHLATQVLASLGGHLEFANPADYDAPESCAGGACVVLCLPDASRGEGNGK